MDLSTQLPDNEFIMNTALPECNREATNANDVYNIYDIVPQSKLETLYDKVTQILNDGIDVFEEYVCFDIYLCSSNIVVASCNTDRLILLIVNQNSAQRYSNL